ncbi:MAG: type II secretion system F family protein, partial [Candidatus Eremiobacteraeota bacterium]|nr:type II secretion system F family protein [Candidatus Eremiobacteraeota bacterium]
QRDGTRLGHGLKDMAAYAPFALIFGIFGAAALAIVVFWERLSLQFDTFLSSYAHDLERAAIVVTPAAMRKHAAMLAGSVLAAWGACALVLHPPVLNLIVLLVLFSGGTLFGVRIWIAHRIKKRLASFANQLEIVLRLLVSALRVGLGLRQALAMVVDEMPSPAGVEFSRALAQTTIGVTMEDALDQLAERMPSAEMTMLTKSIRIQSRTGGNLAKILLNLAEMIKQRRRIDRRIKSLTAESVSTKYVITALPVSVTLFILTFEPDLRSGLLDTFLGHLVLGFAIILLTSGWFLFDHLSKLDV